jgi:hypothetical protein
MFAGRIKVLRRLETGGLEIQYAQLATDVVIVPVDEEGNELRGQALWDWLDTHMWDNYIPKGTSLEADPDLPTQLGIDGLQYTTVQLARRNNAINVDQLQNLPLSMIDDARLKSLIYEVLAEIEASKV